MLFYLLAYGAAVIGAFAVVTLVREVGADGVVLGEATHLSQWAGLGRRSPWLAGAFCLFMLSFAGIPLTAGFVGKFAVFSAAVEGDAAPLAVAGVVGSAIAVFFYIRIVVLLFFTDPPAEDGHGATTAAGSGRPATQGARPRAGSWAQPGRRRALGGAHHGRHRGRRAGHRRPRGAAVPGSRSGR